MSTQTPLLLLAQAKKTPNPPARAQDQKALPPLQSGDGRTKIIWGTNGTDSFAGRVNGEGHPSGIRKAVKDYTTVYTEIRDIENLQLEPKSSFVKAYAPSSSAPTKATLNGVENSSVGDYKEVIVKNSKTIEVSGARKIHLEGKNSGLGIFVSPFNPGEKGFTTITGSLKSADKFNPHSNQIYFRSNGTTEASFRLYFPEGLEKHKKDLSQILDIAGFISLDLSEIEVTNKSIKVYHPDDKGITKKTPMMQLTFEGSSRKELVDFVRNIDPQAKIVEKVNATAK